MKSFSVYVEKCFSNRIEVQANSKDDAENLVRYMINAKKIDQSQEKVTFYVKGRAIN